MWQATSSVPRIASALILVTVVVVLGLPFTLVVHDLRTSRRVHPATIAGVLAYIFVTVAPFIVAATPAGHALMMSLSRR